MKTKEIDNIKEKVLHHAYYLFQKISRKYKYLKVHILPATNFHMYYVLHLTHLIILFSGYRFLMLGNLKILKLPPQNLCCLMKKSY